MQVKTRSPVLKLLRTICLATGLVSVLGTPVSAQECEPLNGNEQPMAVVQMLDSVAVQQSRGELPVAFQEVQETITLATDSQVYLSSTADGTGWLSTDDQVQVRLRLGSHMGMGLSRRIPHPDRAHPASGDHPSV